MSLINAGIMKAGGPLFLFITLVLTLAISVYFGNSLSSDNGVWNGTKSVEGLTGSNGNVSGTGSIFTRNYADDNYPGGNENYGRSHYADNRQPGTPGDINPISDYYKWLSFWNIVANSNDPQAVFQASNYAPKTSIVPPVCPTCPSCRQGACGGVCSNCGGYGGAGTQGAAGHRFSDYDDFYGEDGRGNLAHNEKVGAGDVAITAIDDTALVAGGTVVAATGLAAGAGYGAYKLANSAGGAVERGVKGAAGMAKDTVVGGVDLAKDTVVGGVDLAKDAVGGTVDLAKDAVGGTVDLAKDAGRGVAGLLTARPTQVSSINGQGGNSNYGTGVPGANQPLGSLGMTDPYSYYGALANKGSSNYIPITTDFSAFGK